jgi:nucleotide-binding universal stress UspA family protein
MKIVLATDGSGYARIAEEVLTKFEQAKTAEWHVVSVATPLPVAVASLDTPADFAGADELSLAWHHIKAATKETATQVAARLKERGFNATDHLLEGDPAREILDYCTEIGADLVALGSRGMGGFMSMLLGSVARRMVTHAPCSVLVSHPREGSDPEAHAREIAAKAKLDVVVAADGSDGAKFAMAKLGELGHYGKGIAVCVEPISVIPPGLNPAEFGYAYRYDSERSEEVAQHGAEKLANICDSVFHLVELGRPAHVLVEQAKKNGCDLIVLGATQHGFFERFLLGSVSTEVANEADCSVLIVRVPKG